MVILDNIKKYLVNKFNELNVNYNYNPLSENDIEVLIYELAIAKKIDTTTDDFIKYKDCEFFTSNDLSGKTKSIFDSINGCYSITGRELFKEQCFTITNNINELISRQGLVREISISYLQLDNYINEFSKIENGVYWHLKDKSEEFNELCSTLYFNNRWLRFINEKQQILSIYYFFKIIWTPLWGVFGPVVFFLIPYLFSKYILKIPIPFKFYWGQLKNMLFGKQLFTIINVIKDGFKLMRGGGNGGIKSIIIDKVFEIIVSPVGKWIYFIVLIIGYLWTITNSIMLSWNTNKFTNFIHKRMNNVYKLFTIFNAVRTITKLEISDLIDDVKLQYIDKNGTHKFINEILSCKDICGNCGITKMKGECLRMYWKLKNNKHEELDIITIVIKYLGLIDKLVNQTKLIYGSGFTFAEYMVESSLPRLDCVGIFNPVMMSKCIKNDIKLYLDNISEENNLDDKNYLDNISEENNLDDKNYLDNISEENNLDDKNYLDNISKDKEDTENKKNTENKEDTEDKEDKEIEEDNENTEDKEIEEDNEETEIKEDIKKVENFNDVKQNCILTGPNGSGKSSMLKTILINVILSQSLGIVPAQSLQITPFKYISSYLNIADAQGKESLFQAEMSRCHNHLEKLKSLEAEDDGFSFNIMDEIFVSTNYFEGVSGAYGVIKTLENYKKSINIITTHFDALTKIENRGDTYCFKYFTINDDGSKDYKIRSGINEKHCALTLLEDRGFDKELCNNAKLFYKQIRELK
jgi:DNA replication protein DnaC